MTRPADIKLMALDCEPVWLARFCGQRRGVPANDRSDYAGGNHSDCLAPTPLRVPFHAAEIARD